LEFQFHPIADRLHLPSVLKWINVTSGIEHVLIFGAADPGQAISEAPISDHQQSWGYEDGP